MAEALVLLAQGGKTLATSPTQQARLRAIEAHLPEQTPVQLALQFSPPVLPVVGRVDLAGPVASAVNTAYRAGRLVMHGEQLPLWNGATLPATHDALRQTVWIRWKKGQPWNPVILAIVFAVIVAGFIVWQWMTHWEFSRQVAKSAGGAVSAVVGTAEDVVVVGLIGAGVYLLLRKKQSEDAKRAQLHR